MSSDGSNPGFMEDPWKPDDACLTAVFGQNSLLITCGQWGNNGYLSIAPHKTENIAKDGKAERIDGPGMLLIFSKPDDARDLERMLSTLANHMEVTKERGNAT